MRGILFISISCLFLLNGGAVSARDWRDNFKSNLLAKKGDGPPSVVLPEGTRALFVSGFLTDFVPGTFQAALETLNLEGERATVWTPSSFNSIVASADEFAERFRRMTLEHPSERFIVVGHSRGAVVLWVALLKNADLFSRFCDRIIFLQGAFGGSKLAEAVGAAHQKLSSLPAATSTALSWLQQGSGLLTSVVSQYLSNHLQPEDVSTVTKEIYRKYGKELTSELRRRMAYVATWQSQTLLASSGDGVGWAARLCAAGLALAGAPQSDGVLAVSDQFPPGVHAEEKVELVGFDHTAFTGTELGRVLGRSLALSL